MRFLYVNRVTNSSGDEISGLRHFDEFEPLRSITAGNREKTFVAPGVISEAIGQLASWLVLKQCDFSGRPVFMFADRIEFFREVPVGTCVDLKARIASRDNETMVFSGEALIEGQLVARITNCHCHMVPLEKMEDPLVTRARFVALTSTGENYEGGERFPVEEAIRDLQLSPGKMGLTAKASFAADSFFYRDHFPREPVTPIVMINEVIGELTKRLCSEKNGRLLPRVVENIKIRNFVRAGESFDVKIDLLDRTQDDVANQGDSHIIATRVQVMKDGKQILRGNYSYEWRNAGNLEEKQEAPKESLSGSKLRRVAVTGIGAVTPLGTTFSETWQGILARKVPVRPVSVFAGKEFPTNFAYEVDGFSLNRTILKDGEESYLNRAGRFLINAADEAMSQSGWSRVTASPQRRGVCLGVGIGCPDFDWYADIYMEQKWDDPSVGRHNKQYPATVGSILGRVANARGGITTVHTACASSGQALGEAYEAIAHGELDVVLTGGADSMINPFHMAGFCLLGALSKRKDDPATASRPFDVDREGFVLGEGACALVFEDWDHAVKRGAKILGEIVGYGVTESAFRITDLHPEGTGPFEAMQMAMNSAGIDPKHLGYVNAHGTSTQLNDRVEALAVRKLVGASSSCRVSSTKSMTGHLISAAGAIEFAFCVQALRDQVLPPSINVQRQDPTCEVTLTESMPMAGDLEVALSNSVGFGGSNTALVARRLNQEGGFNA